jgi:hypothetical protein
MVSVPEPAPEPTVALNITHLKGDPALPICSLFTIHAPLFTPVVEFVELPNVILDVDEPVPILIVGEPDAPHPILIVPADVLDVPLPMFNDAPVWAFPSDIDPDV